MKKNNTKKNSSRFHFSYFNTNSFGEIKKSKSIKRFFLFEKQCGIKLELSRAFGLLDVIIGTALASLVFLGVFGLLRLENKVVEHSKLKITAIAISNKCLEEIRNLSYSSVGIAGGFPDGLLETTTTTLQNNILYTIETRIDYVIDSTDGLSATSTPQDDCPMDYKKVEVKVSWPGQFGGEVSSVSNIIPENLTQECEETGGILSVSVFDAYGLMISSPLIEIKNPETDLLIKSATPADGKHYFSLNSSSSYKIVISKVGMSTEGTYGISEVATPKKPHIFIFENQLTETSFSIDETSSFSIDTSSPWGEDSFYDSFSDQTKVVEVNNIEIDNGEATLSKTQGVYFTDGTTDSDICSFPGNSGDCAQSFTMGPESKQVSEISLYLRKATTSPSNLYLEIRSASTTGALIASSTEINGFGLPINFEWVSFSLNNPVTLSANTIYFLRLRSIPDSVNNQGQGPVHWGFLYSTSSPLRYGEGKAFRYVGKAGQEELSDYDFSFQIYGDEYVSSGYLVSATTTPTSLLNWNEFSWTDLEPINTNLIYQIYYASGSDWFLIPNEDLPGNEAGLGLSPIDLSSINTATYTQLKIKGSLSSTAPEATPRLYGWQLSWITESATPIPGATFSFVGTKVIGTDGAENSVYKYSSTNTSNGSGHIDISSLEWDSYTFSVSPASGLDLINTNPSPQPVGLLPDGTTQPVILYLEAENSLLLNIQDSETLEPVFNATARLYNVGLSYDTSQNTNEKGQSYFLPLEIATYDLQVSASGYLSTSTTSGVNGDNIQTIKLERVE